MAGQDKPCSSVRPTRPHVNRAFSALDTKHVMHAARMSGRGRAPVDHPASPVTSARSGSAGRLAQRTAILWSVGLAAPALASADLDWVRIQAPEPVGVFEIARTETTVAQFQRFAQATGWVTRAERLGGGQVFEAGWVQRAGWTWQRPYGQPAQGDEPAVHVDAADARAFCRWAGGDLPTDTQWATAAHTEWRPTPAAPFKRGQRYRYPTGDSPQGAQCLGDCGEAAAQRAVAKNVGLSRGQGHARVAQTPLGVNGLFDMGANAWEWTRPDGWATGAAPAGEWRTRGGSWWYGSGPMSEDHAAYKPVDTSVVYIGFRCARALQP